jgi:hypothetical protein
MRCGQAALLALVLAPVGVRDNGCEPNQPLSPQVDTYPGDPRVNEGAQGRINATIDEQDQALGPPAARSRPLSW